MSNLDLITGFDLPEPDNRDTIDKLSAGMALQNPISRYFDYDYVPTEEFAPEEGYNPLDDPSISQYDPMLFVDSKSPKQTQNIVEQIKANQRLLRRASGAGGTVGEVLGVLGNPILTVPAILTGGTSLSTTIATEVGAEILNERILHSQQPLRTKTESLINIGAVGGITAIGGRIGKRGITSDTYVQRKAPGAVPDEGGMYVPVESIEARRSASVVADDVATASGEGMVRPGMLGKVGDIVTKFSPAGDVLSLSPSKEAKSVVERLVEVPYRFKSEKAVEQSVETAIKQAEGDWASMKHFFDDQYMAYRKSGGNLSVEDFDKEVARAMRNGDVHDVGQIQAVARQFRKFDDNYFEQAVKLGLYGDVPPRLVGSKSHLQRIYNRNAIAKNRQLLIGMLKSKISRGLMRQKDHIIVKYYDENIEALSYRFVHEDQINTIRSRHPDAEVFSYNDIARGGADAIDELSTKAANSTVNRMLGGDPVDIANIESIVPRAGSLHERTLSILSDKELEPFLNNNALDVMSTTSRQMYREIEMGKMFHGDRNLKHAISRITNEYDELMSKAVDEKQLEKLQARKAKDIRTVQSLRDIIMGTYGIPKDPTSAIVNAGRGLRIMAMLTYGANITSSSLSDLVAPSLRYGLRPFSKGMKVVFSGMRPEYIKTVQRMGIAVESITSARAAAFAEMAFNTRRGHKALHAFGKWTGLNGFTDFSQAMNAISTSEMWQGWFKKYAKISVKNKKKLLDVGIDEKWAARINDQLSKHGAKRNGVTLPETHLWDDMAAAKRFENALRKEVNTTTLFPGKGDLPLWMKSEQGKFFSMFMSFMMSSTQKWVIAGFQRSDIEFLQGMMLLTMTGGVVEAGKSMVKGRDVSEKEPIDWVIDSMDRGGALGVFSLPISWSRRLVSGDSPGRVSRGMVEQFMMPAGARYGSDVGELLFKVLSNDELTDKEAWDFARAVPLANSFHLIDLMERASEE